MIKLRTSHLHTLTRRFWGVLFSCIIAFAVIVQLGRQAFPLLNDYRPVFTEALGKQLGVDIEIASLDASWKGLRPKVILRNVRVLSKEGVEIFSVKSAKAELSLLDSVIQRGLAWRTITFDQLEARFEQKENNAWGIQGYDGGTANNENPLLFDDPLDVFLFGRRVDIRSASLTFYFRNGNTSEMLIPHISLDNDRFFHRMSAAINVDDQEMLKLVIEGYGDPRDRDSFSANAYLRLNQIPTADVYNAVIGGEDAVQKGNDGFLNLELWVQGAPEFGLTAVGRLVLEGMPSQLKADFDLPTRIQTDLIGGWNQEAGWSVNLQEIDVLWNKQILPIQQLGFYGKGAKTGIRLSEFDIESWIEQLGFLLKEHMPALANTLDELHPRGTLRNIDVQLKTPEEGYFRARMYLQDAGTEAFMGSPALGNIHAYIDGSMFEGIADINIGNGFKLGLERVFNKDIVLDRVNGQLGWKVDREKRRVHLRSGEVVAKQKEKNAIGYFGVEIPFTREDGEAKLDLLLHVDKADAREYEHYLPLHLPDELKSWLGDAVESGRIKDVDFFYSGAVVSNPELGPVYQLSANVYEAKLSPDPGWPSLTELSGNLSLDSNDFEAEIHSAFMSGNLVEFAYVNLIRAGETVDWAIGVEAQANGELQQAKTLLLNSPIKSNVEAFLPGWELEGQHSTQIKLQIPLAYEEVKLEYAITSQVENGALNIVSADLPFTDVKSELTYSKDALLTVSQGKAKLWGKPILFDIDSDSTAQTIYMNAKSVVDIDSLKEWLPRPEWVFFSGDFSVESTVSIPLTADRPVEIVLSSVLKNTEISLPEPFHKAAEEEGVYTAGIGFYPGETRYRLNLNNLADIRVNTKDAETKVHIALGELPTPRLTHQQPDIYVAGILENADFDQWVNTLNRYLEVPSVVGFDEDTDQSSETAYVGADIRIGQFYYSSIRVDDLALNIKGFSDLWLFRAESDSLQGEIRIPVNNKERIQFDMDYVSLFEPDSALDKESLDEFLIEVDTDFSPSVFQNIDLSEVVPISVKIQQLKIEGDDWGGWFFQVDPIENGVVFNQLSGWARKLKVGSGDITTAILKDGEASSEVPENTKFSLPEESNFTWTIVDGQHRSAFKGRVSADDLGDTLEAWNEERLLKTSKAEFDIDAFWHAPPDKVSLSNLTGDIDLRLKKGSFYRGAETGENPLLRLIALFNFDTLARRIRLDFSDLAVKGFAFDRVNSSLRFADGVAIFSDPLIVESSSSKMQMAGEIDVINERVDAQLVVTLPVAGNLAVAAVFVAGLPAAVGIYVVSKMLGKKVDKVSSINYSVEGKWDDPKIKVRKIFDDQGAKKKGESLKRKAENLNASNAKSLDPTPLPAHETLVEPKNE